MKATFNEKQMQKDALKAICETIIAVGNKLIDTDVINADACPVEVFEASKDMALVAIFKGMEDIDIESAKKMREEMITKYTKIDYGNNK